MDDKTLMISRWRSTPMWIAIGSLVLLIAPLFGIKIVPDQFNAIYNSILSILVMGGILIDPTTKGISDGK